jgi:4-amino-4-deoxy-L-arabinose transferase-like glycosyltransferase
MKDVRRFTALDALLLLLVLAVAGAGRAWYLSACCRQGTDEGPYQVQDAWQEERDTLVHSLSESRRLVSKAPLAAGEEKTAHASFVYPLILSALDQSAGDLAVTYQRMRWLQVGLGALTAALYYLIARRAFQRRFTALVAGLLCAAYPFWIVNTAEVNDGVLASLLLALCLFLGIRGGQQGGALTSLFYGIALAALGSLRIAYLLFAFVAILWFLRRSSQLPRGWMYALVAVLGFVCGLFPWFAQTYRSFGDVSTMASAPLLHFWIGNNSQATGGPQTDATMTEALAGHDPDITALHQMGQAERYRTLARAGWNEMFANPGATWQRRMRAAIAFLVGDNWLRTGQLVGHETTGQEDIPDWLSRSATALFAGSLLVMLVLGVIGWRWSAVWRYEAMPTSLAAFWIFLPYLLTHAESFHGPRLPLDGVLLCYTALVICSLVPLPEPEIPSRYDYGRRP